jgi:hypothetical protein
MQDNDSSLFFGIRRWTLLLYFFWDILFGNNVISEKPNAIQEMVSISLGVLIVCLHRVRVRSSSEHDMIMIDHEIKPGVASCQNVALTAMFC